MCCGRLPARLDLQGRLDTDRAAATTRSEKWGRRKIHRRKAVRRRRHRLARWQSGAGPSPPEERAEDHPGVSASPQPSEEAGDQPSQPASGGSVRFQDPATTRPRPPTVGETRAREKAERKRKELEKARVEAELKRYQRNQRLKGGAAVVGVVGVVAALGYWALSPRTINAQCVQEDANGRPDHRARQLLHRPRRRRRRPLHLQRPPVPLLLRQQRKRRGEADWGTTIAPKGTTVKTSSGTTIQRGGLGSKFSGSGGG